MSGIKKINSSLFNRNEKKDKVVKYSNEESLIARQLNNFLQNKNVEEKNKRPRKKKVFYPSTLGNTCDRALFLEYHGLLPFEEIDSTKQRIFDHGHATENRFFGYFLRMGMFKAREVRAVTSDPPISGRADFILTMPDTGNYLIVELKTINDNGFGNLLEAKSNHVIQLQIYLNVLEIDDGVILYENKNDQRLKEFAITKDTDCWNEIIQRCHSIQDMSDIPEANVIHSRYCSCNSYKGDEINVIQ